MKKLLSAAFLAITFSLTAGESCSAEEPPDPVIPSGTVLNENVPASGSQILFEESEGPASAVVINEAVSYDEDCDWVEIKNLSSGTVSLSGLCLSDSKKNLEKYAFPDVSLAPGEFFLVYCPGSDSSDHPPELCAPFSISSSGETLYLSRRSGTVLDTLEVKDVPLYGSTGRMTGSEGVFYFSVSTPGADNGLSGCREISSVPQSSVPQGVYDGTGGLSVELLGSGRIHYTLDGSLPTEASPLYTRPFTFTSTAVLRAVCVEDGKLPSAAATFSYIVNEYDELPAVSIVCDPDEMFGFNGVYTADRSCGARTDADVSFFEADGTGFQRLCGLELHGTATRKTYSKKSLELKFSGRFGGDLHYDLFQDGNVTSFHKLVLRGGNLSRLDLLKDSFAAKLLRDTAPDLFPLDTRYTVAYINGAYYGIYAWREAYSEEYFTSHTGAKAEDIQTDRSPLRSGEVYDVITTIGNKSMQSEENYAAAAEILDMGSVARWFALEAYFNNMGINANVRYVRLSPAEKWRMVLFDLDYSCTSGFDGQLGWTTVQNSNQIGPACAHLKKNTAFRELLLREVQDLTGSGFTPEHILRVLDDTVSSIPDSDARKDCARWESSFEKWRSSCETLRGYLSPERYNDWLEGLCSITGADKELFSDVMA